MPTKEEEKASVRDFWERASCGEELYLPSLDLDGFAKQAGMRYDLEPYILPFLGCDRTQGLAVLEVGVGLGADHEQFARSGAHLTGIDLTKRAIELTAYRFQLLGLHSDLISGDCELLPFPDSSFDHVYSWGVIHHTPNTQKAAKEILRVLKPGGSFRIMIYHRRSLIGYMLWIRYALFRGRPFTSLDEIYANHLESPGTKAFTPEEAKSLLAGASQLDIEVKLTHGDLLSSNSGQRHQGFLLSLARIIWPRWFIRRFLTERGLFLLISGRR